MFRSEEVQLIVQLLYMCIFCVLTALCAFSFLNIFTDHKYNENLTHAQTTSTGPASLDSKPLRKTQGAGVEATGLPNRYKSENSAWDRSSDLSDKRCCVRSDNRSVCVHTS